MPKATGADMDRCSGRRCCLCQLQIRGHGACPPGNLGPRALSQSAHLGCSVGPDRCLCSLDCRPCRPARPEKPLFSPQRWALFAHTCCLFRPPHSVLPAPTTPRSSFPSQLFPSVASPCFFFLLVRPTTPIFSTRQRTPFSIIIDRHPSSVIIVDAIDRPTSKHRRQRACPGVHQSSALCRQPLCHTSERRTLWYFYCGTLPLAVPSSARSRPVGRSLRTFSHFDSRISDILPLRL